MGAEHLTRVKSLATNPCYLTNADREALAAMLAEREAVVNYLKSKCDPRTNPGGHQTAFEALVIAGERQEAKDGSHE